METIDAYIPMDRRQALAKGLDLPDRTSGAVLFADISGFTRFSGALYRELGPKLGAEELTRQLNYVYGALIDVVHRYGGSVISFGGDGVTCWFDADNGRLATACALDMQAVMNRLEKLITPAGNQYLLGIKVAITSGAARRFLVGKPRIQRIDVLAGEILDRMAAAENQLQSGEVVIGAEVMGWLGNQAIVEEWRKDENAEHFAVITGLTEPIPTREWPQVDALDPELARDWILPPVYQRLMRGMGEFLAELRSAVAIFLKFQGINYDRDDDADAKLDKYIGWVQSVLAKYEGFVLDLNVGDKGSYLFSALGARVTHEDDVDRALTATLELLSPPQDLDFIHSIQIGITRGEVRVGAYGSTTRRTYGANGAAINLASRLMDKAAPGEILVSERIVNDASPHFVFEELEPVLLRGLDDPFRLYRFTSGPQTIATDILGRSIYPIVGRQAEKTILKDGLNALVEGRSGVFLVEGEAGIGKTRLVEYALECAQGSGVTVLAGAGDEIGKSSLYYAWRPVLEGFLELDYGGAERETASRKDRQDNLVERIGELAPELVDLAPLMNAVLPVDIPENDFTRQMTGEARADNIRELLVEILSAVAKSGPLMLVLEDAHWLDSASWAVVRRVTRDVHPLMLVTALRPFVEPISTEYLDIKESDQAQVLPLTVISPGDVETMICDRLGVNQMPQPVLVFVQEKAEGNPFYSEELVFALRDGGLIQVNGDQCRITAGTGDLMELDFPDTIQDIIRNRIDRLGPQEQMALKVASVIGRIFAYHLLYDVHPIENDKPHLLESLDALEKVALTRLESPEPDLTYMFKQIITREVAYNLMLFTQRRDLHRAIAEWFERTFSDDLEQVYSLLAYHWNHTEEAVKAVVYLEQAGEQAMRNFANKEAVTFLSAALKRADESELLVDEHRRANWELLLGEAYVNLADYVEGRQHLEAGLALLGQPVPGGRIKRYASVLGQVGQQLLHRVLPGYFIGRKSDQSDVRLAASRGCERLVEVYYVSNEMALSLYTAFRTLNLAEAAGASPELARGYGTVGALVGFIPFHGAANNYLHRALDTVEAVQDLNASVWVNIVAAFYYGGVGNWSEATRLVEDVVENSYRMGDQRRREDGLGVLCALDYFQGDFISSLSYAEDLIRISRRRNAEHSLAFGLSGKAYATFYLGQFDDTRVCLDELNSLLTEESQITNEALTMEIYGLASMTRLRQSDPQGALEMAGRCTQLTAKSTPSNFSSFSGFAGPACTYISLWKQGYDHPELEGLAWNAIKILKQFARIFPIGQPRRYLYEGEYLWLTGKQTKAQKTWTKSLQHAHELEMRFDQGLAHLQIGLHLPEDDPDRRVHLTQAEDIFSDLKAAFDLARTRAALSASRTGT